MTAFSQLRIDDLRAEIRRLAEAFREERRLEETRETRLEHAREVVDEYFAALEVEEALEEVDRLLARER